MRQRKAIFTESLDLAEDAFRELAAVAPLRHTVDQASLEALELAAAPPCGHRPPQGVRLSRREARRHDRKLHDLLLEDGHAERALEHGLDVVARIGHGLLAVSAPQIR